MSAPIVPGESSRLPGTAPVQGGAVLVGVIFVVLGTAGFIPGLTQHWGELRFATPTSGATLAGLFRTSILANLIHLATGVVGLVLAHRGPLPARNFLFATAAIYFALFAYGLDVPRASPANFLPVDDAANFLNLLLTVVMIVLGIFLNRTSSKVTSVVQAQE